MWRRLVLILVLVVGGALVVLAMRSQPAPDKPFFAQDGLMVIAHQGGNLVRPDNTLLAFEHAAVLGVDVLEMDVHLTADDVLVVIHDDTVDRTTDGNGRVVDMTLADLQTLDAAYSWTLDDGQTFPYRGQGITVPTLESVFQAFPDWRMNIEIKPTETEIIRPLCNMIQQYGKEKDILIASFHEAALLAFRQACPNVATSMYQAEIQSFFILNKLFLSAIYQPPAEAFQVPEYFNLPVVGETLVVSPRFVRNAHKHNINVHVWTVNEPEQMARMIDVGVDGIITDRPDLLLELLGR